MKLVDEIIEVASDSKRSLADALRKCLVLAFELKNEKLKKWVESELNGFGRSNEVPEYRKVALHSKGTFSGPFGAGIKNAPLPVHSIFEPEHLEMLTSRLVQPIAAYESGAASGSNPTIPWHPDLILVYQSSFVEGYALASAWQVVPNSLLVGLCEEVRNRMLRFALEIKEELGLVKDKPFELPPSKIEAAVVNHIYGGTNVIAGTAAHFSQIGSAVIAGDLASLRTALKAAKVPDAEADELERAVKEDDGFGKRTRAWLQKIGQTGTKIGVGVGQDVLKEWIMQYLDLK